MYNQYGAFFNDVNRQLDRVATQLGAAKLWYTTFKRSGHATFERLKQAAFLGLVPAEAVGSLASVSYSAHVTDTITKL